MAIELTQWRVYLVIAERGSLMKAAETLRTDQPALSRSLRRLERLIGAPLFIRSNQGLTLTELGRRLHQPVRDLVEQSDRVESDAHAEARRTSGVLRIGAIDVYPVTSAIARASQDLIVNDRPITTELISLPWLAHQRAVLERSIDVGFTLIVDGRLPHPETIRSHPLWEEVETFVLIADHHPAATADVIDPRDLADLPLHLPDKSDNPDIYHLILETLADAGLAAPRRASSPGTFANVIAHIAAGNGWLVSAGILPRHLPPGTVTRPLAVTTRHTVHFAVIWHINSDPTVIDIFTTRFQNALPNR
jgi:DNA-binding transcriptional LysR family regulator